MPRVTKKTSTNPANITVQTSRGGSAKGLKRPPRDLEDWIRLANLIPRGQQLPGENDVFGSGTWPDLLERIAKLPDPLRSELLAHSELPEDWQNQYTGNIRIETDAGGAPEMVRMLRTYDHFVRIQIATIYLRLLARPAAERTLDRLESFITSLRYAELSYLRECEYCGKVFYAKRKTQSGCTPAHGSIIRKKKKRDRDRENAKLITSGKVKVQKRRKQK